MVTPDISFGSDSDDDSEEDNIIREPEAKKDYVRRVRSKSTNSIELVDDRVPRLRPRAPVVVGTGQFTKLPKSNNKSTEGSMEKKIETCLNEKNMQCEDEDEDIILLD